MQLVGSSLRHACDSMRGERVRVGNLTPWRARLVPTLARMRLDWANHLHLFLARRNTCLSLSLAARHSTLTAHLVPVAHQLDGSKTCMHNNTTTSPSGMPHLDTPPPRHPSDNYSLVSPPPKSRGRTLCARKPGRLVSSCGKRPAFHHPTFSRTPTLSPCSAI